MKIKFLAAVALLVIGSAHASKDECLAVAADTMANALIKQGHQLEKAQNLEGTSFLANVESDAAGIRTNPPRWLDKWYDDGVKVGEQNGPGDAKAIETISDKSAMDFFRKKAEERGEEFDGVHQSMGRAAGYMLTCGYKDGAGMAQ